jgi:hypothetical protein
MLKTKKLHKLEDAISRYSLNVSNVEYIKSISEHLENEHPLNFLRKQLSLIDTSLTKLPASRFSLIYWKIRGYSEIESKKKVSLEQAKNGSFEEKRKKFLASGVTEADAEAKIRELAIKRGELNSNSHKKAQEKDPLYLKKMSHHFPEFWIKKGFSEEEAKIKAYEVCSWNRKRFREKLDSGEVEKGWNNTTIEYYLKTGMNMDEAKQAIIDRQKTFTLEKCIAKYGEIEGKKKWEDRQKKWMAKWKDLYYKGVFSTRPKDGNSFSKPANMLFSMLSENYSSAKWKSTEWYLRDVQYFFYDFTLVDQKKIIEFNGDYWHCNPIKYSFDFYHTIKKMTAQEIWEYDKIKENVARSKGYEYLVIWESDYKLFPNETINKCKEFLAS